jgi:transposase
VPAESLEKISILPFPPVPQSLTLVPLKWNWYKGTKELTKQKFQISFNYRISKLNMARIFFDHVQLQYSTMKSQLKFLLPYFYRTNTNCFSCDHENMYSINRAIYRLSSIYTLMRVVLRHQSITSIFLPGFL